jgi:hypothetical protein
LNLVNLTKITIKERYQITIRKIIVINSNMEISVINLKKKMNIVSQTCGFVNRISVITSNVFAIKDRKQYVHEILLQFSLTCSSLTLMLIQPFPKNTIQLFCSFLHGLLMSTQIQPPKVRNGIRHHKRPKIIKECLQCLLATSRLLFISHCTGIKVVLPSNQPN